MNQILHNTFEEDFVSQKKIIKKSFEKPKVSIVIPIYNVEKYIQECFKSLTEQTLKELEFICIDDGSTDKSFEILQEYAKYDARFIVLTQKNKGQGVGRNKCIELAKGEYIAFVDPDDKLEPNAMEELYNYAKKYNAQVVQFNYTTFGESTRNKLTSFVKEYRREFKFDLSKNNVFNWQSLRNETLLTQTDYHVWARFYKTSFVKENKLKFAPTTNGEDHLFVIGMLFSASEIYFLDKNFYHYRLRPGSIVNTESDKNFCVFTNLSLTEKFLKEKNLLPEVDSILSNYKVCKLIWHYNQIPKSSSAKYIEQAKEYLSEEEFKYFDKFLKRPKYSFVEQIFSIKNERNDGVKYKYLTILGIHFLLSPKKKRGRHNA